MGYLKGTNREQCGLWVLEDMVDGESMARVIDRYIEVLNAFCPQRCMNV